MKNVTQIKSKSKIDENYILGSPYAKWKSPYAQQGDVLIKKIGKHDVFEIEYEAIPSDAKQIHTNLILKGRENSHALFEGEYEIYEKNDTKFLRVTEPTILDHVKNSGARMKAEHYALYIPPGEYFIDVVKERDHLEEETRRVID